MERGPVLALTGGDQARPGPLGVTMLRRLHRLLPGLLAALAVLHTVAALAGDHELAIQTAAGASHRFTVEVVDTPEGRAQGLMFRQELAPDAGMLFDFTESRPVSFWMQNTFIPLDMLFIGADGVIRNIHVNARPLDPTGIPSDGPVRFVLEIPGGRSVELGIAAGDRVEHPRVTASGS
jgi:uncharacterized protein